MEKLTHLRMINHTINRLARQSAEIKRSSASLLIIFILASVLLFISSIKIPLVLALVVLLIGLDFWYMDGRFLRDERLYRALYEEVRTISSDAAVNFDMSTVSVQTQTQPLLKVVFSRTLTAYHGGISVAIIAIILAFGYT